MKGHLPHWLKVLFLPKVFIPTLLAAALLTFAFSLGDLPRAWGYIRSISFLAVGASLGLALAYLAVKGALFRYLLGSLGIRLDWRPLVLAYSVGEMTLPLPAGVYAQNYVLQRIQGLDFALSSAATTAMLLLELLVVLLILVLEPIPGWYWLRPAIITFLAIAAAGVLVANVRGIRQFISRKLESWSAGRAALQLMSGLRQLVTVEVALIGLLLSAAYLLLLGLAFLFVARGVGITEFTLLQAVTTYSFSLAVMLLIGGFITQLGVIEVIGLEATQAWGYGFTEGLAMLLGFRLVWLASIWVISGPIAWMLKSELHSSPADG